MLEFLLNLSDTVSINRKIVFVHSLNNFTGSSNVLAVVIRKFVEKRYSVELITSKGEGFLSDICDIKYHHTSYRWTKIKSLTLLLLLWSQAELFFKIFFTKGHDKIYYINTIIPFGAVLACWLSGKKYVYHVHEDMRQNKALYIFLRQIYKILNRQTIFVSKYLESSAINCRDGLVVYNGLDENFLTRVNLFRFPQVKFDSKLVLMVSSLRSYKGIYEFCSLARMNADFQFELVLSASAREVEVFNDEIGLMGNLKIFSIQKDLHPFYYRASMLLQLSHPDSWIETFGMTILEAMTYGVPCIVPNVGGPLELIDDGVNGFVVDPYELEEISEKISLLFGNKDLYFRFCEQGLKKSKKFDSGIMVNQIDQYLFGQNCNFSYD